MIRPQDHRPPAVDTATLRTVEVADVDTTANTVTVTVDGEQLPDVAHLDSYHPHTGDKVAALVTRRAVFVLGKIA